MRIFTCFLAIACVSYLIGRADGMETALKLFEEMMRSEEKSYEENIL